MDDFSCIISVLPSISSKAYRGGVKYFVGPHALPASGIANSIVSHIPKAQISILEGRSKFLTLSDPEVISLLQMHVSASQEAKKVSALDSIMEIGGLVGSIDDYKLIRDVESETRSIWFNEKTKEAKEVSKRTIQIQQAALGDDAAAWRAKNEIAATLTYNPTIEEKIFEKGGIVYFNRYEPPEWKQYLGDPDYSIVPFVIRYLKHLFPIREQREDVCKWASDAVWGAYAYPTLFLVGTKHIGKTLFINLLSHLVGPKNTYGAGTTHTGFDMALGACKLWIQEEGGLTEAGREREKQYAERDRPQVLNEKFEKQKKAQVWASRIIAVNYSERLYITKDDRKFFLPDMTSEPFDKVFPKGEDPLREEIRKAIGVKGLNIPSDPRRLAAIAMMFKPYLGQSEESINIETRTFNETAKSNIPTKFLAVLKECEKRAYGETISRRDVFNRSEYPEQELIRNLKGHIYAWGETPFEIVEEESKETNWVIRNLLNKERDNENGERL